MKNQAILSSEQTFPTNANNLKIRVSPSAIAFASALVGLLLIAAFGIANWSAYLLFLPISALAFKEVKAILSLDLNFTLDDDFTKEMHNDLW